MRKIPYNLDNPIDNLFIYVSENSKIYFRKLNFTPNMITTLALITSSLGLNSFWNSSYLNSFLLLNLSYFFDCLDGHYARSYNMETEFGDYYDHFCDMYKFILLVILSYVKDYCKFLIIIPFLSLSILIMIIHLGCQEVYFNNVKIKAPTLTILKNLCPAENEKELIGMMKLTKYMGTGTINLMLSLIPIYYSM